MNGDNFQCQALDFLSKSSLNPSQGDVLEELPKNQNITWHRSKLSPNSGLHRALTSITICCIFEPCTKTTVQFVSFLSRAQQIHYNLYHFWAVHKTTLQFVTFLNRLITIELHYADETLLLLLSQVTRKAPSKVFMETGFYKVKTIRFP